MLWSITQTKCAQIPGTKCLQSWVSMILSCVKQLEKINLCDKFERPLVTWSDTYIHTEGGLLCIEYNDTGAPQHLRGGSSPNSVYIVYCLHYTSAHPGCGAVRRATRHCGILWRLFNKMAVWNGSLFVCLLEEAQWTEKRIWWVKVLGSLGQSSKPIRAASCLINDQPEQIRVRLPCHPGRWLVNGPFVSKTPVQAADLPLTDGGIRRTGQTHRWIVGKWFFPGGLTQIYSRFQTQRGKEMTLQ